jgi:hypothetical protein
VTWFPTEGENDKDGEAEIAMNELAEKLEVMNKS